jgi:hypothetical protein
MHKGSGDEFERQPSQIETVASFDTLDRNRVIVDDILQKRYRRFGADEFDLGVASQQRLDGARVVRLVVVDDQVIDLLDRQMLFYLRVEVLFKSLFDRIDQSDLLT